jgi:acyl-coenzyme A thioesterase PaaI-like protein
MDEQADEPPSGEDRPTSLFTLTGDTVVPTGLARGPWSPDTLHGGPVAALLAHELATAAPGPVPGALFPARLTMELFRPVTFDPHRVTTRVVRPGRRVQVIEATLTRACPSGGERTVDDAVVARAMLQQIEHRAVALPDDLEHINGPERRPPSPEQLPPRTPPVDPRSATPDGGREAGLMFHVDAIEHRSADDLLVERGRATDWIRVRADLFPGTPLTRFERVAAAADFGNGISNVLPFDDYVFVNPDLSLHLFRLPIDEWVCLDAVTRIGLEPGDGSVGLAESVLFDRRGRFGRALQSLLVAETGT